MNQLVLLQPSNPLPALVAAAGERAGIRFLEFFASTIRNPHTRRAYARAVGGSSPGARIGRALDHGRAAAARGRLDRAADAARCRRRPSSSSSPRSAICLTGWSPARSCRVNPAASVRGPSHSRAAGQDAGAEPTEARTCSTASM